jgi:hypothetical protein
MNQRDVNALNSDLYLTVPEGRGGGGDLVDRPAFNRVST